MTTFAPASRRFLWPVAMTLATLLLGSCGGGSGGGSAWPVFPMPGGGAGDPGTPAPPVSVGKIALATLSGRADMVTGGDTLLEVALPEGVAAADVRVTRNGEDVTAAFAVQPGGRSLRGLVTGLALGNNTLAAKASAKAAGNWP
jgi:hypothetical protein